MYNRLKLLITLLLLLTACTVKYRTVSLSALAGKHFTAISGEVHFDAGNTEWPTGTAGIPEGWTVVPYTAE